MSKGRPYKGALTERDQANREILVNIRRQSGMTQREFCENVFKNRSITANSYRQYETGERRVPEWLLREVDMYFINRQKINRMRYEITITRDEFRDLCASAFYLLTMDKKLTMEDLDHYTDFTAALMFMFTDEYQERRHKK